MDEPSRISRLAIVSAILSFLFIVPLLSGLAAIVFGIVALYTIGLYSKQLTGKWLAIIGIVMGFLQFVAFMLLLIFFSFIAARQSYRASAPSALDKAEYYSHKGDYEAAIRYYEKAMDEFKWNKSEESDWAVNGAEFLIYNNIAGAYQEVGRTDEALSAYKSALNSASKSMGITHYGIGTVYSDLKEYEKAIEELDMAVKYNPQLASAYQEKAAVLRMMGKPEESLLASQKTIGMFPEFAKGYSTAGLACEKLERYEEAIKYHFQAIRFNPKRFFPRDRLYFCFYQLHNPQKTQKYLEDLRKIDYNFANTLEERIKYSDPPDGSEGRFDTLNKGPRGMVE